MRIEIDIALGLAADEQDAPLGGSRGVMCQFFDGQAARGDMVDRPSAVRRRLSGLKAQPGLAGSGRSADHDVLASGEPVEDPARMGGVVGPGGDELQHLRSQMAFEPGEGGQVPLMGHDLERLVGTRLLLRHVDQIDTVPGQGLGQGWIAERTESDRPSRLLGVLVGDEDADDVAAAGGDDRGPGHPFQSFGDRSVRFGRTLLQAQLEEVGLFAGAEHDPPVQLLAPRGSALAGEVVGEAETVEVQGCQAFAEHPQRGRRGGEFERPRQFDERDVLVAQAVILVEAGMHVNGCGLLRHPAVQWRDVQAGRGGAEVVSAGEDQVWRDDDAAADQQECAFFLTDDSNEAADVELSSGFQ